MTSPDIRRASLAEIREMKDRGEIVRGEPRELEEDDLLPEDFWEKAELVSPPRVSVHLKVAPEVFDFFKRGDYQGAINGFGSFIKTYPRSPLVASAQYWIGNAQYARRDYRASIATQRQLLKEFPDNSKVPDAMLNIASAQADMGDSAAARRTLEELIAKYPKSDAGTRARQRLGNR